MAGKKNPYVVRIRYKEVYEMRDVIDLRDQLADFSRALDVIDAPVRFTVSLELECVVVTVYRDDRSHPLRTYTFNLHVCRCRYLEPPGEVNCATWHQGVRELCYVLSRSLKDRSRELKHKAEQYMGAAEHMDVFMDGAPVVDV